MNTPKRNLKNIEKMQKLGKVYSDDTDERRSYDSSIDEATKEDPLPTVRRVAWVVCGGFWVLTLIGLLFGVDMRPMFPFLFLSVASVSAIHIPVFVVKRKIGDVIMGTLFTLGAAFVGISMFVVK